MMRKQNHSIVLWISIYLLLLSTSGFYFHEHSEAYYVPLIISVVLIIIQRNITVNKQVLVCFLFLSFSVIISALFSGDSVKSIVLCLITLMTALLISTSISKEVFVNHYCGVLYCLCIGSIVLFILNILGSNIINAFLPLINGNGVRGYYALFSTITLKTTWVAARNASIFWEAGVFQTYVIIAFIFEISKYGTKRINYIMVYVISIITTLSTTGIMCLCIMSIIWAVEINAKSQLKGFRIVISLLVLFAFGCVIFYFIPKGITNKTFDKFIDILNGDLSNRSVATRIDSIVYPIKSFLSSPIIGVGESGLQIWTSEIGHSMRTCTPLNWFARFGIVFGLLINLGFIQFRDKLYSVDLNNYIVRVLLLLTIFTEAYTTNITIFVFAFYGFQWSERMFIDNTEGEQIQ